MKTALFSRGSFTDERVRACECWGETFKGVSNLLELWGHGFFGRRGLSIVSVSAVGATLYMSRAAASMAQGKD